MENNGWIKIHRKMLDSSFSNKPNYGWLWMNLLLMASHKDSKFIWNGKEELLKSGQILTGRKSLSSQTGIPESTVEDILNVFENSQQIRQQKTTKFRLITINKWTEFQISDSKATTKQQQSDTYKNVKNERSNIYLAGKPADDIKIPLEEEQKKVNLQELYKGFGLPKSVRYVSKWQDEAANAIKLFTDGKEMSSSIFKCFKENNHNARIALSDCKELGKFSALYFFKVYNQLKK